MCIYSILYKNSKSWQCRKSLGRDLPSSQASLQLCPSPRYPVVFNSCLKPLFPGAWSLLLSTFLPTSVPFQSSPGGSVTSGQFKEHGLAQDTQNEGQAVVIMKALEVEDEMWGGQKPVQLGAIYPARATDRTASACTSPTHGSINNIDRAAALSMGLQCGHEKKDKETTFTSEQTLLLAVNGRVGWGGGQPCGRLSNSSHCQAGLWSQEKVEPEACRECTK